MTKSQSICGQILFSILQPHTCIKVFPFLCSPGALEVKYGKVYGEQETNSPWSLERPYHLN